MLIVTGFHFQMHTGVLKDTGYFILIFTGNRDTLKTVLLELCDYLSGFVSVNNLYEWRINVV